jgi:HEAT repeat protein
MTKKTKIAKKPGKSKAPSGPPTEQSIQDLIAVLRNRDQTPARRLDALRSIQTASFSSQAFDTCRGDYIAALRETATDPDADIRQRSLGVLARNKDGFAQKKLIEGLKSPDKALVPTAKALQLLSHDPHAEAYKLARTVVDSAPDADSKREALRVLAADTASAPVLERVLRDKNESTEVRQTAAASLHALRPESLQTVAREMVMDDSEEDDVQATCLAAITHFGNASAIAGDADLVGRVKTLGGSRKGVKHPARQFLDKYGR